MPENILLVPQISGTTTAYQSWINYYIISVQLQL